jgi:acylglycerol lipase
MQYTESSFKGQNNFDLYMQVWTPPGDPASVVILVHGIAEHCGRYSQFADFLASRGMAVYTFDLRGHGKSPGQKGYVEHFAYFMQDLAQLVKLVKSLNPDKKIFLFGHSMGAVISLAYASGYGHGLSGLIVSGIALKIKPNLPVVARAALLPLAAVLPRMPLSKLDSSSLSKDKIVVEAYDSDPLVFRGKLTTRLAVELVWEMGRVERRLPKIRLSIFIVHSGSDNLSGLQGAKLVYDRISSKDKELKIYPGLFHEILNEPEKPLVMADIFQWLKRHY